MIRSILAILLFFGIVSVVRAQDSTVIATITIGDNVVLTYPESALDCAIETTLGVTITSVSVAPFGTDWALWGTGTSGGNNVSVAFTLARHGQQLYLVSGGRWDQCTGVDCSGCEIKKDAIGRPYCNCFMPSGANPKCNHATGEGSGIVDNLLSCAE